MVDGFYSIYYTGLSGRGFGLIALNEGAITGIDAGGGTYDGQYCLNDDGLTLNGDLKLILPIGASLVTGAYAHTEPIILNIPLNLPTNFNDGQVLSLRTETGPINIKIKKLRDLKIREKAHA